MRSFSPSGDEVVRIIGSERGRLTPRYYATLLAGIRSASRARLGDGRLFRPDVSGAPGAGARRAPRHRRAAAAALAQRFVAGTGRAAVATTRGLLRAGVKIYEREDGILHSKTIVTDSVWSIVGSSNFDHRSVLFNDEVDAVVIGQKTGAQLERYFFERSATRAPVDPATWQQRPVRTQAARAFLATMGAMALAMVQARRPSSAARSFSAGANTSKLKL